MIPKSLLAGRPTLGKSLFSRLAEIPCIGYGAKDEILSALCAIYSVDPAEIKIVRATENYTSIAEMAEAKLGWAVIPSYLKVSEKVCWSVDVPSKALPIRQFFGIYRSEYSSVPWFKELILGIQACFPRE